VVALVLTFMSGLEIFDWFRERMPHLVIGALTVALVAAAVAFGEGLLPGLSAQWTNLGEARGHWGFYILAILPLLIIMGWRNTSREYRLLAYMTMSFVLATFASKMLDGGQTGSPDLGRVGWSDSLNRMWLHGFGIFIITAVVGLVQRANQGWPIRKSEKEQHEADYSNTVPK
jgi:Mn2+/Fe2+ NRAMP family transporter